jgi:replication factor A1
MIHMPVAARNLTSGRGSDRDLVYLLMLAKKYGLEPVELHNALVKAKSSKEASCGPLSIQLREHGENASRFMFSQNDRSVAQAAVSDTSLAKLRDVPPEFKQLLKDSHSQSNVGNGADFKRRIADLQFGLKHVSLKARVTDKSEVRAVESRNGSPLAVCIATLSDGTGEVRLPLWNRQIETIAKDDTVIIHDATVKHFRGEMQLSLPWKTGSISTVQPTEGIAQ